MSILDNFDLYKYPFDSKKGLGYFTLGFFALLLAFYTSLNNFEQNTDFNLKPYNSIQN